MLPQHDGKFFIGLVKLTFYAATFVVFLPLLFNLSHWAETTFRPVIVDPHVTYEPLPDGGVSVKLSYTKVRDCEFLGISWYRGPVRLIVDDSVDKNFMPRSSLPGPVVRGPWVVQGIEMLEGTRAAIWHKCHPLWPLYNRLYP